MTNIIILSLLFSVGFNLLMFIPAFIWKTDKLTDLSYSITFFVISVVLFLLFPYSIYSLLITLMVCLWAIRLGSYLFIRIRKTKKDKRFDGMRESFTRFLKFWLLQGLSVWVIMLAVIMFYNSGETILTEISILGLSIWLIGLIIETVADIQKYSFINKEENRGKWINRGLWKYSRHPNYFGEILIWLGIFMFVLPTLSLTNMFIAFMSPLFIFILIRFVSGVPMLEKSAERKWGENSEYKKYKEQTNLLIVGWRK